MFGLLSSMLVFSLFIKLYLLHLVFLKRLFKVLRLKLSFGKLVILILRVRRARLLSFGTTLSLHISKLLLLEIFILELRKLIIHLIDVELFLSHLIVVSAMMRMVSVMLFGLGLSQNNLILQKSHIVFIADLNEGGIASLDLLLSNYCLSG